MEYKGTQQRLNRVNRKQIQLAGPRYSPGLDASAPNLQIGPLIRDIGCLAFDDAFRAHVAELGSGLAKAMEYSSKAISDAFGRRTRTPETLRQLLATLVVATPRNVLGTVHASAKTAKSVEAVLESARSRLFDRISSATTDEERSRISGQLSELLRVQNGVRTVRVFVESNARRLLTVNRLFLVGEWGTGKTHFLCDIARRRMDAKLPTLLILAQHLPVGRPPLEAICETTGVASSPEELLSLLQRLGRRYRQRALLIVDGVNEGDQEEWRRAMLPIAKALSTRPNIGMIASCRMPFDRRVMSKKARASWVTVAHPGFSDVEFDAQLEFFKFYRIPAPQTPLLTPEFSRPLFLKIFCETIRDLSRRGQSKYLRDIASGQKGMTKALEDFVKHSGQRIEHAFHLPFLTCWHLLKGSQFHGEVRGISPLMASTLRDYITRREALDLVRLFTGWTSIKKRKELLHRLLADGLLMQSVRWLSAEKPTEVIALPYQRFSDHLIARHLLDQYLNVSSPSAVARSFYANRPLSKVFALRVGDYEFAMPGIASAIMLEFPERVKRVLPLNDGELAFQLPKARRSLTAIRQGFLQGLYWRSALAFNRQTDALLNLYLTKGPEYERHGTLEVLLGLATRPGHPYSAARFYDYLASYSIADRDLLWSEYLRYAESTSAVFKLLGWVERTANEVIRAPAAAAYIKLLALMLTTTRRKLRDRVTQALYLMGRSHPQILFDETLSSLRFNDPYIPERMLAACYGTAMNGWADPTRRSVQSELPGFADKLVQEMFLPNSPSGTKHVLRRDYALGIIELARKVSPNSIRRSHLKYLNAPFGATQSPFPHPASISDVEAESMSRAFRMDFENYTLGSLVPGRQNYDRQNLEYRDVRKQILWRVRDLGYNLTQFQSIDDQLDRMTWHRRDDEGRIDRYGKKYSWIAFFEMYGVRSDANQLREGKKGERTSDADLDPSFPVEPIAWKPKLRRLMATAPTDPREWISNGPSPDYRSLYNRRSIGKVTGPWVLLDGYIQEPGPNDSRRLFTFLRGVFVTNSQQPRLMGKVRATEYPGNYAIPDPMAEHYTYAGEIPWSHRFAGDARTKTGRSKRDIRLAFERYDGKKLTGVRLEIPIRRFGWESYHSSLNAVSGVTLLAPSLCDRLELVNHEQSWELYGRDGRQATLYRECHEGDDRFSLRLLYIRRSLLRKYLLATHQSLVMVPWGERTLHYEAFNALRGSFEDDLTRHYDIHKAVHLVET